jgi:hypothetical protein
MTSILIITNYELFNFHYFPVRRPTVFLQKVLNANFVLTILPFVLLYIVHISNHPENKYHSSSPKTWIITLVGPKTGIRGSCIVVPNWALLYGPNFRLSVELRMEYLLHSINQSIKTAAERCKWTRMKPAIDSPSNSATKGSYGFIYLIQSSQ